MEEKLKLPTTFERNVEKKVFSENIVYANKGVLEEFFRQVAPYKGPFIRSMFVNHGDLIRKANLVGIKLCKNRQNGRYYIDEEVNIEPVLFNTELLDIPNDPT